MRGITIHFDNRSVETIWPEPSAGGKRIFAIPTGERGFAFFFRPILPQLQELWWIVVDTSLDLWGRGDDPAAEFERAEQDLENYITTVDETRAMLSCRPGFLPLFAPRIVDDWAELIGFRATEANVMARRSSLMAAVLERDASQKSWGACQSRLGELAECVFYCRDGFTWEMYALDTSWVERVAGPLAHLDGLRLEIANLSDRDVW